MMNPLKKALYGRIITRIRRGEFPEVYEDIHNRVSIRFKDWRFFFCLCCGSFYDVYHLSCSHVSNEEFESLSRVLSLLGVRMEEGK